MQVELLEVVNSAMSALQQAMQGRPGLQQVDFDELEARCQVLAGPEDQLQTSLLPQIACQTKVD